MLLGQMQMQKLYIVIIYYRIYINVEYGAIYGDNIVIDNSPYGTVVSCDLPFQGR